MIPRRAWLAAATTLLPGKLQAEATPLRLPPVTLLDQAGRRWPLGELVRHRPVLVSFFFTGCTTVCPPQTAALADLQAELARRAGPPPGPLLLSISLDPTGDTPANLGAYAARFGIATGAAQGWLLLGGAPEALARVWAAFEVPGGGPENHLAFVWTSPPGGRSWHRDSAFAPPEALAARLLDTPA